MADETPTPPSPQVPAPSQPASSTAEEGTPFEIGEEFGTAKRNLPPARIVVIGVVIIVVVAGIVSFVSRAKPQGAGSIDNVTYVEVPDQKMVLVAMRVADEFLDVAHRVASFRPRPAPAASIRLASS